MRSVIDSLLQSVNKVSEINKKIQTYPYGINAFRVYESEMQSKNKLNRSDEDKDNTICIINIKDKDRSECIDKNMLTMVYFEEENELIDNNNWTRKKTVKIFWYNNTISEICEKWIFYCNNNYAYIRSEELHTHLGELLYTREHTAGL